MEFTEAPRRRRYYTSYGNLRGRGRHGENRGCGEKLPYVLSDVRAWNLMRFMSTMDKRSVAVELLNSEDVNNISGLEYQEGAG